MKKQLFTVLLALGVTSLAGVSVASAQTDPETLHVTVPFRFIVGETVLPAGQYEVKAAGVDPSVVWFTSQDGQHVAVVSTIWGGEEFNGPDAKLAFDVYGGHHFLSAIEVPGEGYREVTLPKKGVEQELARLAVQSYERGLTHSSLPPGEE
jgi:hypothetical protein